MWAREPRGAAERGQAGDQAIAAAVSPQHQLPRITHMLARHHKAELVCWAMQGTRQFNQSSWRGVGSTNEGVGRCHRLPKWHSSIGTSVLGRGPGGGAGRPGIMVGV